MPKRKLQSLSLREKLQLISVYESGKTREEVCAEFNVPKSTLCRIIQSKHKIESQCSEGQGKLKRVRLSEYPELELCLLTWVKQLRNKNVPVSGPMIKEKAQDFARRLDIHNFCSSNGWMEGFNKRNDIVFKAICGESNAVDVNKCSQWIEDLPLLLRNYSADDILNADETGLFYNCLPDKTFTLKGESCHGGKLSKERITILLGANMSGTEKLPILLIGKSKSPRCFKGVKTLPVNYQNNEKAWMTSIIFSDWLRNLNQEMKAQKRKILMFVDNCTAHNNMPELSHIKLVYLPAYTTSKLQPMDQGIIDNFKIYYRKEVVRHVIKSTEDNQCPQIDVLQAMRFARKAWFSVTKTTIANCFKKSGFKSEVTEAESLQPTFQDFINVDDGLIVSGELNESDIVHAFSSSSFSNEEDDEMSAEVNLVKISKHEAVKALETLHSYFEMSSIGDPSIFDKIYNIEKHLMADTSKRQTKMTDFYN
ncbi:tigger transposable element-derived protein 4-like [Diorhabda sublineata]|uniref:tigger transposable element-derived protein 4-like n=1 Tax=Diorhabda sublineata TaxID=1163346 RepID=UPI0024E09235|nr:tigger transposable element-derived protein 4-like [Diorhabda sublineata]